MWVRAKKEGAVRSAVSSRRQKPGALKDTRRLEAFEKRFLDSLNALRCEARSLKTELGGGENELVLREVEEPKPQTCQKGEHHG